MIDDGAKLGVSSRGLGSLESKGNAQYVKDDFQLATEGIETDSLNLIKQWNHGRSGMGNGKRYLK